MNPGSSKTATTILIAFLVLLLMSQPLIGQTLTDYSFIPSMGTFTPLTGATVPPLSGGTPDDGYYNNIPIGFTFNYLNIGYTMLSATTNGCVVLGQTLTSSLLTNDLTNGAPRPILAPLWDDLDQDVFGTFSYKTEGTAPNRVFTAEWLNFAWNFTATEPVISFQLKLYEADSKIEFIYRQEAGAVVSGSASIGITATGTGPGNFLSLDGTGSNPNVSSTVETNTLNTKPATGQIYAFMRIPYTVITHTPLVSDTFTGPRLLRAIIRSEIGLAGPPNEPRLYYRTTPGAYTSVPMTNIAGDTWQAIIPGQTPGTMVEYYLAAQDTSTPPLVMTAPRGGSGVNPPGNIPPPVPYFYYVQKTISGIKYIVNGITGPDTYPSFTAAINDLNQSVIGPGGVIFNVPQGQVFQEILPVITATGSSIAPIVFQKIDSGPNPVITRIDTGTVATSVLGGQGDAVVTIDGGDYITFDGIDILATNQQIEYGYYLRKRTSDDACKNVTIKNCNITMTKGTSGYVVGIYASNNDAASSPGSATGITVTSDGGRTENLKLLGNNIQNVFSGIILRGNSTYPDLYPVVGDSAQGNTITNYAGNTAQTAYGVYMIYQILPRVGYNYISNTANGGTAFTSIGYGIMNSTTTNGGGIITNNTIDLTTTSGQLSGIYSTTGGTNPLEHNNNSIRLSATGGSGIVYFHYITGTYPRIAISDNTFMTNGIASTGTCYLIYNSNPTNNVLVANNRTIGPFNRTAASGAFYGYYNLGSPTGGTEALLNNNFSNITLAGTSSFYGIYSYTTTSQNRIANNNVISNITGGTGAMYCLYFLSTTSNEISNNTVNNITGGGTVYGLYFSGTNPTVYNNTISNITTSGTTIYGIYNAGSGTTRCYNNKIFSLTSNTTGSPIVDGIYVSTGTSNNIYNNFISDLKAPTGNSATAIAGIYIASGTAINLYYNSIYLNATSTGATFGTMGVYASTTPTVDMRNNIIVNTSTPNGAGLTVAYRRSSTTLTTYALTSNNNCFYAGTPSASRLIFYDGTNSDQTLAAFKARVAPRDLYSVTEAVNFVSTTDLHIDTLIPTRLESGAQPISWISTDIDGNPRVGSSKLATNVYPDIGADEFSGLPIDELGPVITYTPLLHTSSTGNRTLTVTIVDLISGVSVEPGRRPTLYYNKNRGSWFADSLLAPPWVFTINTALLGGVSVGDTVFYYVAAYDSSGNMATNPLTAPAVCNFYVITSAPLSGNYTVGLAMFNQLTGRNVYFEKQTRKVKKEVLVPQIKPSTASDKTELTGRIITDDYDLPMERALFEVEEICWVPMENGLPYTGDLYLKKTEHSEIDFPEDIEGVYATITAAVSDLNLRGVIGPTNFWLVDPTYPNENYPITINIQNEYQPTSTNTITIKPNSGMTVTISGSSDAGPIFRIISSYITIDGSNSGGTDRNLTIANISTTTPQVITIASGTTVPTVGVTVKNCIIINGATTSSAVIIGNPGYFNNITIENNSVQKAYIGIYALATPTPGNGSGTLITRNDLTTAGANAISLVGIYLQGVDGAMVSNNNIGNYTTTYTANVTGIWFATGTINSTIANNNIGPINITTAGPRGIVVTSGLPNSNVRIVGNTITQMITSSTSPPYGIYVFSTTNGVVIEKNKVSSIYNTNTGGYGARGIHIVTGLSESNILIKNNFVWDIKATSDVSASYWGIGIGIEGTTGNVRVYNNSVNLYGTMAGYSSATVHTALAVIGTSATALDIRNNIFVNAFDNTNSTTDRSFAINCQSPASAFINIDHNDYYVSGPAGVFGYLFDNTYVDLTSWRNATGQDQNSISADPSFTSNDDLHIPLNVLSVVNRKAISIAEVTDDIDNEPRHPTSPDIGADEYTPNAPAPFSLLSPNNGAIIQPLSGRLIWQKSPLAEFYNVYLDVINPPNTLVSIAQTETTYQYNLEPNKTYYWQVVALNDTSFTTTKGATCSEIWSFETELWDVGVVRIIKPGAIGFAGNLITPKVVVKNFGNVPKSFKVTMKIGTVYTDTQRINNLEPQDTLVVNFEPWTAILGNYVVIAYTTLNMDNNPQNDTAAHSLEILEPAHDVGVLEIISPAPETILAYTPIIPQARIKNFGAYTETFNVRFKIGEIYSEIVTLANLESSAETIISFPVWLSVPCSYPVTCSTELEIDQLPENDKLSKSLTVQYYDLGISEILAPVDTVLLGEEIYPRVRIVNNSLHIPEILNPYLKLTISRYPAQMSSYCSVTPSLTPEVLYEITSPLNIPIGETTIVLNNVWRPVFWDLHWIPQPTYHEVLAQIIHPQDMNPDNNSLTQLLTVKCNSPDLQMNWVGFLLGSEPQNTETLPIRTYNVASAVSSGLYNTDAPFRTRVQIWRENDNALVYSRYLDRTLSKYSYLCLTFNAGFTPSISGWYRCKSWIETRPGVDNLADNNMREDRYYFTGLYPTIADNNTNQTVQFQGINSANIIRLEVMPNPLSKSTTILWQIPQDGYSSVNIYDATGRLVKTLFYGKNESRPYTINWERNDESGQKVKAGVYFCELKTPNQTLRTKLIVTN